jgi:N-acetylmuramoyl-L-alanine amidase
MTDKLRNTLSLLVQKVLPCFLIAFLFLISSSFNAKADQIKSMRIGQGIGTLRIVLDADSEFSYKVFLLDSPKRLVIDTFGMYVHPSIENIDTNNFVSQTRVGNVTGNNTRIVFDLSKPVTIKKVFLLAPQSSFGWRFVIDLNLSTEREFTSKVGEANSFSNNSSPTAQTSAVKTTKPATETPSKTRKVVVLDPGHGGKDPGAIGYSGVYEKNITLAFGRELKKELETQGYKVYLTRNTDVFIPLRERVNIARKYDADLFISIHADSTKNRNAKGLSVYTLSENASDKEAAALAERENKADVIAGLNLVEHSKEVSDILINLAQRETMNRSSEFATFMVREMRKDVSLVNDTHRFAGFAVLKAPDIPSVLLEMGYLSNRTEEKLLKQASYRKKLAVATRKAIDNYFRNMQQVSLF